MRGRVWEPRRSARRTAWAQVPRASAARRARSYGGAGALAGQRAPHGLVLGGAWSKGFSAKYRLLVQDPYWADFPQFAHCDASRLTVTCTVPKP